MATNASAREDATGRQRGGNRERGGKGTTERGREPAQQGEISKWEWLVGAIGLVLLLGLVGFLAREAATEATPPDLRARVDSVSRLSSGWLAHVHVANRGRETAVAVTLQGELVVGTDTLRSETTFDYVPGRSDRGGGLLFDRDPSSGSLTVRATGYQEP